MATNYFCQYCRKAFSGHDPIVLDQLIIGNTGVKGDPWYPLCPTGAEELRKKGISLEEMTNARVGLPAFQEMLKEVNRVKATHRVSLHTVWGGSLSPSVLAAPTAEQIRQNQEESKKKRDDEAKAEIERNGRILFEGIMKWIDEGGKVVGQRLSDNIYPRDDDKALKRNMPVVAVAARIWIAAHKGKHPHVLVEPKHDWRNGRIEADFIMDNERGGKHIAHVIVTDAPRKDVIFC